MTRPERVYADPTVTLESRPYWEGTLRGELLLKSCNACGRVHFYPRTYCPHCLSPETVWQRASGRGQVYSWSAMRRAEIPYILAYVTLEEGVTMLTNLVDCDPGEVAIGQQVEVVFRPTEGGQALPMFRPVQAGKGSQT